VEVIIAFLWEYAVLIWVQPIAELTLLNLLTVAFEFIIVVVIHAVISVIWNR